MKAAGGCWPDHAVGQGGLSLMQGPYHKQLLPLVLCARLQESATAAYLWVEAFEYEGAWWFLLDGRTARISALECGAELALVSEGLVVQARANMVVHPWLIPELAAHCLALYGTRFVLLGQEPNLRLVRLELMQTVRPVRWDERSLTLKVVAYDEPHNVG